MSFFFYFANTPWHPSIHLCKFPDFCGSGMHCPILYSHTRPQIQSDIVEAATITCGPNQSTDRRVRSVAPFHVKHAEAH